MIEVLDSLYYTQQTFLLSLLLVLVDVVSGKMCLCFAGCDERESPNDDRDRYRDVQYRYEDT